MAKAALRGIFATADNFDFAGSSNVSAVYIQSMIS
jgi:hypothetical protein